FPAAHVAGADGRRRAGALVRRGPRGRQRGDRACDRPGADTVARAVLAKAPDGGRVGLKLATASLAMLIKGPPVFPGVAACPAVGLALGAPPADFVASHQQPDGGFAEAGQSSDANLTSWAVLGLTAAGKTPDRSPADYLAAAPAPRANDL